MKIRIMLVLAALLGLPLILQAQTNHGITKSEAERAALSAVKGGKILSGEYEKENGRRIWSFDVRLDGGIKEVWVDPFSGRVIRMETESAAAEKKENSQEMKSRHATNMEKMPKAVRRPRISKSEAERIALKAVPGGRITEGELEHEHGMYIWSMDVLSGEKTVEVWVSPKTGKVIRTFEENERGEK